jgi:hypothetical protein
VSVSVSCSYLPSKSSFLSLQNLYLSSFFFFSCSKITPFS